MINYLLAIGLCLPFLATSQTAYYDALYLAERYPLYQNFIKETERYRGSLETHTLIENTTFQFGNKKEAAYFAFATQFLQDPLREVIDPFTMEQRMLLGRGIPTMEEANQITVLQVWDHWVNTGITPSWQTVVPFLDASSTTIMSSEYTPLYRYDSDTGVFYHYGQDIPVELFSKTDNTLFVPSQDHQLIAIYNPTNGGFYALQEDSFDPQPSTYYNPLENNIYEAVRNVSYPITASNAPDEFLFTTEEDILLLYFDKANEAWETVLLGNNFPVRNDNFENGTPNIEGDRSVEPALSTGMPLDLLNTATLSAPSFPSMAIDALAQFLVDRTKEELVLAFFERFLDKMDQSVELRTLFPNSYFLLQSQDLFRLPSMGPLWVETFQSDLFQLLPSTEKLLLTDPTYAALLDQPKIKAFRLTHQLLNLYEEELTPLEILDQIVYEFGNEADPISKNTEILYGIANELRHKDEQGIFTSHTLSPMELRKMDYRAQAYFTALLYYRNRAFLVSNEQEDEAYRFSIQESPRPFFQSIINLSKLLNDIQQKSLVYRNSLLAGDTLVNENNHFFNLSQTVHQLLEFGFKLQYLSNPTAYFQSEEYQSYFSMIRNTIQASEDIHREELGLFLIHYLQLFEPLVNEKFQLENDPNAQQASRLIKDLFFYASFMVDILSARNSQQISGILQQYALPVGSYRLKRRSEFSLEVNAYPGLYVGIEEGLNNALTTNGVMGITAPIGLSLSWGDSQNKNGQSFGVFLPVIDIGAAFSYRWKGEATGFPEQLRWRQVLSPGLHGVWGFRKLPISLMGGMQFTPQLRKIDAQDITDTDGNVWRYGVSLVVDIPMFNLYLRE